MSRDASFDPGVRCPVYDGPGEQAFRCSRDAGHPGAHVHRADRGRGAIGWAPWAGEARLGEDGSSPSTGIVTVSSVVLCSCPPNRGSNYAGTCPIHDVAITYTTVTTSSETVTLA